MQFVSDARWISFYKLEMKKQGIDGNKESRKKQLGHKQAVIELRTFE